MGDDQDINMYQVCLLHARADRALRLLVSKHLEEFELTMMEWLLLATVCNGSKEGLTMSAVAETLDVTLPQVTALTASLVKSKYLKQKVSIRDRRSRHLSCTIAGKRLIARIDETVNAGMREWFKDISSEKLANYIEIVEILANRTPEVNK